VSGRKPMLPNGLVSKITYVSHQGKLLVALLEPVPVSQAIPELTFTGSLPLLLADAGAARPAHAASGCSPPKLLSIGAHLDSVELRQASLSPWPAELRLTMAVRTTESLGVAAAAIGINCDWTLAELGPYQAEIPVGPLVVPVYATLPVKAGVHINGKLDVGTFNVASTTVATVAAGLHENNASLTEQGTNAWVTGTPSIAGSAKLSASVGLQAGIGVIKGANVHLEADFGPVFEWSSGHECTLVDDFGTLSAGVTILGKTLSTPSWTPLKVTLWSGCKPSSPAPPAIPEAPSTPPPPTEPTNPSPNRQAITSYNQMHPGAPFHGYFDVAWQSFTAQSNTLTTLGATVGNPALPAGEAVPYSLTMRLCSTQPASDGTCAGQIAETHPQIVNYGNTSADIGDVGVTPGATYWIDWLQPPFVGGTSWVTFWWAGGSTITSSDQLQMLVQGYNR
jgi:hypothetical protein